MQRLFDALQESAQWRGALTVPGQGRGCAVYEVPESQRAFLACALARQYQQPVLYIAPSEQAAQRAADDCAALLSSRAVLLPAADTQLIRAARSRDALWRRLAALDAIVTGQADIVCLSAETLLNRLMPRSAYVQQVFSLRQGGSADPLAVVARLAGIGYERTDMVEARGQVALRGDLLDVFPPALAQPVRIEFFDTLVDSVRTFDAVSQKSMEHLDSVRLAPAVDFWLDGPGAAPAGARLQAAVLQWQQAAPQRTAANALSRQDMQEAQDNRGRTAEYLLQAASRLQEGAAFDELGLWAAYLLPRTAGILEWLDAPVVFIDSPERVRSRLDDRAAGFYQELQQALERGDALPQQASLLLEVDGVLSQINARPLMAAQDVLRGLGGFAAKDAFALGGMTLSKYSARWQELAQDMKSWVQQGYAVAVLAATAARAERLAAAFAQHGLALASAQATPSANAPILYTLPYSRGFLMPQARLALVTDTDLLGAGQKKSRQKQHAGARLESFSDLKEGDYVVHEHHGVGIYHGVVRLQSEGAWRDYLYIQYQSNDKLYVPTDQFDRIQKYIGGQGEAPALNDLSGGDWDKQKKKVKAGLAKLAIDLVALYAQRQAQPGFAFTPAGAWEEQFSGNFEYELTPDQTQAIGEVLGDMQRPINMDRLLCGDVGYGKTEVAVRAAFRAVMNNRQTAFLAPTTILVQQHFRTLKKRFEGFPVVIDYISRLRSPRQNRETLQKAKSGQVDILIGTHRLLSRDVDLPKLGLLIVDEEQRFGVGHKEKIKHFKKTVDVLTLSATPIPRTLHMSMIGVRDMSLLETPPQERIPVQTYVVDYSDSLIRDAIMRELNRQGQVFFLYNRVADIERMLARLRALVPQARIAIAHGQMQENALEDVMLGFYAGEYDVLLCTTIIENGLDVPRANTLIVMDADHFGLSQLYQLRGRVGRSNRLAYAYFTVHPDQLITETAEKRLSAIREFTEFGAGFRIALRDLEIRGAGNVFGPEQSGQISAVGYDMYCKLIEEAVREAKGDFSHLRERELDARVELHVNAFLPERYVPGEAQRMEIYQRISMIRSLPEREEVIDELIDRFGEPPQEVLNLIDVACLRALARAIGADFVTAAGDLLKLRLNPDFVGDPAALVAALSATDKRLSLAPGRSTFLYLRLPAPDPLDMMRKAIPLLAKLAASLQNAPIPSPAE